MHVLTRVTWFFRGRNDIKASSFDFNSNQMSKIYTKQLFSLVPANYLNFPLSMCACHLFNTTSSNRIPRARRPSKFRNKAVFEVVLKEFCDSRMVKKLDAMCELERFYLRRDTKEKFDFTVHRQAGKAFVSDHLMNIYLQKIYYWKHCCCSYT